MSDGRPPFAFEAPKSGLPLSVLSDPQAVLQDDPARPVPSVVCWIRGLDAVLGGGFQRGSVYEICGLPGSGKTTLLAQVCVDSAFPRVFGGCQLRSLFISCDSCTGMISPSLRQRVQRLSQAAESHLERQARRSGTEYRPGTVTGMVEFASVTTTAALIDLLVKAERRSDLAVIAIDGLSWLLRSERAVAPPQLLALEQAITALAEHRSSEPPFESVIDKISEGLTRPPTSITSINDLGRYLVSTARHSSTAVLVSSSPTTKLNDSTAFLVSAMPRGFELFCTKRIILWPHQSLISRSIVPDELGAHLRSITSLTSQQNLRLAVVEHLVADPGWDPQRSVVTSPFGQVVRESSNVIFAIREDGVRDPPHN